MIEIEYCTRCSLEKPEEVDVLREISRSPSPSIEDINRQIFRYGSIKEKAKEQAEQRLAEGRRKLESYRQQLKKHEEGLSLQVVEQLSQGDEVDQIAERIVSDKLRRELEQAINSLKYQPEDVDYADVEAALKEYQRQGYVDIERGRVRITSKGARLLAKQALRKVLESLARKEIGSHLIKETGYGSEISTCSRPYELGDEYELIDIEKTLLNALERGAPIRRGLKPQDFRIFETQHQSKMCAGVIIDGSGSMQSGNKMEAAIEASLALSELIRREPKDSLEVFTFAEKVKHVAPWDVVNEVMGKGSTDIRAGMRAFRISARHERGDKQAYLITDAEPNTEDGVYVGFHRAMGGVLQEALHYREDGITLNIIMLDQRSSLKEFARVLARKNLGRVLFTTPYDLGTVVIEDYLKAKVASGSKAKKSV